MNLVFSPIGFNGSYYPGPGTTGSGCNFSLCITYFCNSSLPAPKQYVTSPFTWTVNVEVVLLGSNVEGILYLSGDGFISIIYKKWIID